MAFGSWVRSIRNRMGMSQGELSHQLGIHWTTLSRWERGLARPSLGELLEVSRQYAAYATKLDGWIHTLEVSSLGVPGKLAFFSDHGSPILGMYVRCGLERGDRVVVACSEAGSIEDALTELTGGEGGWAEAIEEGQITRMPLLRVWGTEPDGFRPKVAVSDMVAADLAAREAGFKGVRWLIDVRPLRDHEGLVEKLIVVNRAADVFYDVHDQDRALVVYPPKVLRDQLLGGILLALQPRIVVPQGLVDNPFYADRHLTTAVRMLEAASLDASLEDPPL